MMRRLIALAAASALFPALASAAEEGKGYWEYRFTDPATNLAMLALVVFLAIVWFAGGFKFIGAALDKRADTIRDQLEEARRLREEAQRKLAEAEQRAREAEEEAAAMLEQSRKDAAAFVEQSKRELAERLKRREELADARIARAEAEATDEVRRAAADAATEAARRILSSAKDGEDQFARALSEVEKALSRH